MQVHSLAALVGFMLALAACGEPDADTSAEDATLPTQSPVLADASAAPDASAAHDASAVDSSTAPAQDARVTPSEPMRDAAPATDASARDASSASDADARAPSDAEAGTQTGPEAGASPCPEDGACVILPLGDSITYGLGVSDNASYRAELFRRAAADQHAITYVGSLQSGPMNVDGKPFPRRNEGHSGWTISQIAGTVPSPALTTKAHIVLLMAGTNDMYMSPANAPMRLGALLDKLASTDPNMLVVVAQLTPATSFASAVKTFNSAVPALVKERAMAGKRVIMVDMNTGFPSGGLSDGVHPNADGYKFMAGVWYEAIKGLLR